MGELVSAGFVLALLYALYLRTPTPGGFVSAEPPEEREPLAHPPVRILSPGDARFAPTHVPCPRCQAANRAPRLLWQRYKEGDGVLGERVPVAQVRWRDGAMHCRACDLTFYPVDDSVAVERYFGAEAA